MPSLVGVAASATLVAMQWQVQVQVHMTD